MSVAQPSAFRCTDGALRDAVDADEHARRLSFIEFQIAAHVIDPAWPVTIAFFYALTGWGLACWLVYARLPDLLVFLLCLAQAAFLHCCRCRAARLTDVEWFALFGAFHHERERRAAWLIAKLGRGDNS